jgi:DNA-binding SARP family transcriptional activator/tetratricopeptide (TPR) repeat protein
MRPTLHLLGGAHFGAREASEPLPADRRGCLLAYVAYDGGWVDRDRLALLFWPDADEMAAKRNLRQLLLRVRQLPLAAGLEVTNDAVRWSVPTDVAAFRHAIAAMEHERATGLYSGPLLDGFGAKDVGGVDAWVDLEREHLHAAFHEAVVRTAQRALQDGRAGDAAASLRRLLDHDPLAEDVLQPYLRALYLAGRRDAALTAFERFESHLRDELGLEPLPETVQLAELLRRADGLPDPVAKVAGPSAVPVTALRPPRLVARDAEVAAARAARAPLVLVAGEPGIGKSRFLHELLPDATVAVAVEGLERVPYHPFAALLRRRPELATGLGAYREDLARLVPEVAPELTPGPLEPEIGKGRLAEALARVADAAAPLVVDDLQWADAATLETLQYLAARGTRVHGAYRAQEVGPELQAALTALRSRGAVEVVHLGGIDEDGIRALLADLMAQRSGPDRFARWLWRRSGGNAMFALETLRALFESGVLRDTATGWATDIDELTRDYHELDVPPAVSDVIRRRLSKLAPATVRVLEAAAVVHSGFDERLLAGVTGLSQSAVADAIDEAAAAGFVEGGAFRHDLLRQTLQSDLPPARRRLAHALVAEALQGSADEGILAEHWFGAGDGRRARLAWCRQAAALRARGLQTEAARVLERAIERCSGSSDRAHLRVALAEALRESARVDEATALVDAVIAEDHDDPEVRLAAAHGKAALLLVAGRLQETRDLMHETLPLVAVVGDPERRLDHVMFQARAAKHLGRPDEAVALLEPELEALRQGPPSLRLCQVLTSIGVLRDDMGRHREALAAHREAYGLAKALGARYQQVDIALNMLFNFSELGDYSRAEEVAFEAMALGDYDNVPILRNNLAAGYFETGRYAEALEQYQLLQEEHDQPYLRALALARSAEAHAALGDRDPVVGLLDAALDAMDRTDFPVVRGRVAIAVLRLGDARQRERLRGAVADLDPASLAPHLRDELLAARRALPIVDGQGGDDVTAA